MLNKIENILVLASEYEKIASKHLVSVAKEKSTKKKDPKAKVRNRGTVVFPAESSSVKDDKDHFPINDEAQARNALARANQYSKAPEWYNGSLDSLVKAVARKVHSKYPGIKVTEEAKKPGKKKSSLERIEKLLSIA